MTRCLFLGFLLLLASGQRLRGAGEDGVPRATHTTAQLTEGLYKQYQHLQKLPGLEVRYRMETDHIEPRGEQGWRWRWAELVNIIKPTEPGKIYVWVRWPDTSVNLETMVQSTGIETAIDTSDGEVMAHMILPQPGRKGVADAFITAKKIQNYATHYRSFYFRFISYPVAADPDADQAPRERYPAEDYWLPEALAKNRDAYRVRPNLERVDNVWCHVLERGGLDFMWIQTEPNFLLRRRQFHWKKGGPIRQVATFRSHKEVSEGAWLPLELVFDMYAAPWEEAVLQDKVGFRIRLKVSHLTAEPVPDSRFRAEIPKDAVVTTEENRRFINQPGIDPFEEAFKSLPSPRARLKWILLLSLLAFILLLIVLARRILVRQYRGKQSSDSSSSG